MGDVGSITLSNCAFIGSIILRDGLTEIGEGTFYKCHNLETIVIPKTITKISPEAFAHSGLKSIVLPDGRLTEIGDWLSQFSSEI